MNREIENQIRQIPKVILHIHLDGSLRPKTVQKWLQEKGEQINIEEVEKRLMVDRDCRDLNQYLEKFSLPLSVLQQAEHISQAVYELYEDLAKQNVIYAEVRYAPALHTEQGLKQDEIVEASIKGLDRAKEEYGIEGNLILCCMRGEDNKESCFKTVEVAKKYLGQGVSALDLAGAEAIFPNEKFEDIFDEAKRQNIPFTIHAGEAAGAKSIKKALEMGAKRIGHGVRCIEDETLMGELAQEEILLEICPISNLQTKAVAEPHPIDKIYKRGIKTTINTDNNTVSNTDILEEYRYILENTNLTLEDIRQMNINAIRGAFITAQEKSELVQKINEYEIDKDNENKEI